MIRTRTKSSESTSTTLLASLLERYERTLRQRQRAFAIVNDELLDIDHVLKRYREKTQNSLTTQSNKVKKFLLKNCYVLWIEKKSEERKERKKHFSLSTLSRL